MIQHFDFGSTAVRLPFECKSPTYVRTSAWAAVLRAKQINRSATNETETDRRENLTQCQEHKMQFLDEI